MNPLIKAVMIETVREARELSRIADSVQHAGVRGQLRESILARALRLWLPRGIELGTGVIVDEDGSKRTVGEDDIIVHSPELLPPVLPLVERNVFLLDAVLARIEVKTTLSSSELGSAVAGAISVDGLRSSYEGCRELHAVFAYRSTASVRSELVRLKEQSARLGWTKDHPPVSFICVDEKEFFWHGQIGDGERGWFNMTPTAPNDSTLAFISVFASCLAEVRDSRRFVQIQRFTSDLSQARRVE